MTTTARTSPTRVDAKTIRWGILGTGSIAQAFAHGLEQSQTGRLVAVGSRSQATADRFTQQMGLSSVTAHASYEALLADPAVDAVYIATPHPMHARWAILAAEAGKHILCEKPLALNHGQAMAMVEAAVRHRVFFMEAFMYRCHPQTARLVELIQQGVIGQVRMIEGSFGFQAGFDPNSRVYNNDLAGGGILDVGCYPVSMARLIAGAAAGQPFANPLSVTGAGHLGSTGVDEWAAATLRFPGDITAQVATAVAVPLENVVRIFGSKGWILVPNPWTHGRREGGVFRILVHRQGQNQPEEVKIECGVTAYAMEIDAAGRAIAAGQLQASPPAMTPEDSLGNMQALDAWRQAIGLTYEQEKPHRQLLPFHGRPLAKRPNAPITTGTIAGVSKPIARLVMGVDNQLTISHGAAIFDEYFEQGGNAFDTAYLYHGGRTEQTLGWWVKNRGVREQVVIIGKGAHTPHCDPDSVTKQLLISLERLQTDYVDIYLLHRDNPDIPVGEFIDVLNEHHRAGRIGVFGGSNWSIERFEEANAYAQGKGLVGMSVLSNNFSLARMIEPVWPGCVASSDPDSRAWHKRTQTPLLPWSSQARGFFTDRAGPEKRDDAELVRCWYSPDNFERRKRAVELAQQKGVLPINIALAYVLAQPFPTFALIGPRTLAELRTSLPALSVSLTEREVKWLNLEE